MPRVNEQGTSEKYTYARENVDTTSAALTAKLLHLLCLIRFYPCVRVFFYWFLGHLQVHNVATYTAINSDKCHNSQ